MSGLGQGGRFQLLEYWKRVWDIVGYCSGTIAPTTLTNFVLLENLGGCLDNWANKSYKEGDIVHSM